MIDNYENKVKWCPVCHQGWVVIAKDPSKSQLYVYCMECETEWIHPEEIRKGNGTHDVFNLCETITIAEIENAGWQQFLIKK